MSAPVLFVPASFKYRGFLSYSHADTPTARRIHSRLESYFIGADLAGRVTTMGPVPRTLRPIFRDREDFTVGDALADQTCAALDQSAALVVLCSTSSAQSRYVDDEIRHFKWRHPDRPVIPVITGLATDIPERDCFPPALRFDVSPAGEMTEQPVSLLAADLRDIGDGWELALAKVVARLIGLGSDEVFRRAHREQRRNQRRWIAGLSGVSLALAGLTVWAELNRREAVTQRAMAERNFLVAKDGADSLIFDIAQSLRNQEGMRSETVRKILGSAESVIGRLVASSGDNLELKRSQAAMYNEFADTYAAQGDTTKQNDAIQKSLAIIEQLINSDPKNAVWQSDKAITLAKQGDILLSQGKYAEALVPYQKSEAVLVRLAELDSNSGDLQHDVAAAHHRVAIVLFADGRKSEALTRLEDSRAILEALALRQPENALWQRDLAAAYHKIGALQADDGKYTEALANYRLLLAIMERVSLAEPSNARWQHDLAIAHDGIGTSSSKLDAKAEAKSSFEKSLAILERIAKADPNNVDREHDVAIARGRLADAIFADGDLEQALQLYQENLSQIAPIRERDPSLVQFQDFTASTLRKMADVLITKKEPLNALGAYRQSLTIFERLARADPKNADRQHDLSAAYSKLGETHQILARTTEALQDFEASIKAFEHLIGEPGTKADWVVDLALVYGRAAPILIQMDRRGDARVMYQKARDLMGPLVQPVGGNEKWRTYLERLDSVLAVLAP
jgi:tetratricopeptide (TPR) repeat protein